MTMSKAQLTRAPGSWSWICSIVSVVLLVSGGCAGAQRVAKSKVDPAGTLVIAGGGRLPDEILLEAIRAAGGPGVHVLVIPQASRTDTAGPRNRNRFVELGCERVAILDLAEEAAAIAAVDDAQLIWISGGSQNRLMELLPDGVEAAIRRCYQRGGAIGGTSAGAAVMSRAMITGKAKLESLHADTTELASGLGLLPGAIVDQHFHRRRRFNRLLSAVLDRPDLVGIGIDEATAVVVHAGELSVIGKSSALILDARLAAITQPTSSPEVGDSKHLSDAAPSTEAISVHGAHNVQLHVLRPGMKVSLDSRRESH